MRTWSRRSRSIREMLHPKLQVVMDKVLADVADISLISGYRGEEEQNRLVAEGKSKLNYPKSKHNLYPSHAVDFQPYPYPDSDVKLWAALAYVAGSAIQIGWEEGVILRWGGDWNQNGDLTDNTFDDLFHIEIYREID